MKNKICVIFSILMIVGIGNVFAQPVIVEAPPMLMMNPLTADEVNAIGGVFGKMFPEAKDVRFINKLALDKGMRDYNFQNRDWANGEKTIDLCEVLNIDWVVRPQLQKRINRDNSIDFIVTAALLNVKTKEIMYTTPLLLKKKTKRRIKWVPILMKLLKLLMADLLD